MADPSWRPLAGGVAQRRRERRLRSWYRHEQQTVRMALAAFSHHSALRRQTKARAGEEGHEEHDALRRQKPPPPQPELFSLEEEPGGGLPAPLSEVAGRQEVLVRHVVEDLGSVCPVVQILDLPVPHMVDQLAELLNLEEDVLDAGRLLDRPISEQVIEVPKISLDVIPLRTMVPEPQLAEQLVEVPTIVSFSSFQRTIEQTVDIPVPQGGGGRVGDRSLQGFPGQSSTAYCGADFPAATAEQNVDIPVPRGDRTLHPASTSSVLPVTASQGVFRTFPQNKKSAELGSHSGSELPPHPSSSTAAAQLEGSVEWVRFREKHAGRTYFWNRRTNSTVWRAPAGVDVVWYGEKDEKGGVWYWHRDTRVSTFFLPPLPPG